MSKQTSGALKLRTRGDRIFDAVNLALVCLLLLIAIYPLYLVIIASFSDAYLVMQGEVWLYPKGINFDAYKDIFNDSEIWNSYLNSIIYTFGGTMLSLIMTMAGAYVLINRFPGKGLFSFLLVFTMFFGGGLIPTFLTVRTLGLYNTRAVMMILGCVSVWNLMLARTYISTSIPKELYEAAEIDGSSHFNTFFRIVLPLSATIIAVLSVYYGIGRWNDYFSGLIYIKDRKLLPLQTVLKEILASLTMTGDMLVLDMDDAASRAAALRKAEIAKYCIIVVSTAPAIVLYLCMQKFFVKGVMIGSIKG